MSIKQKIILLLCSCFLGIAAINIAIQAYIIFPDFVALEQENIDKNMQRIREGIYASSSEVSNLVRDWSRRAECYQFINDKNQNFINSTIDGSLESIGFEYIGFFTIQENLLYSDKINGFDSTSLEKILPRFFVRLQNQIGPLSERDVRTIVLINGTPVLISISYILKSDGNEESNGFLAMANVLDEDTIEEISDHIQVPFVFDNSSNLKNDEIVDITRFHSELFVRLAPEEFQPPSIFKSSYEREIEQKGLKSIYISFIIITFALFILFTIFYLFFSRVLLIPITNLTETAERICNEDTYNLRIKNKQKDEIGQMAIAFNKMIGTVEKSMANEMLKRRESDEKSIALKQSLADLHLAQKQLIETEKQAALGSLVTGIAHEINTPLSVCLSYTSFLQDQYSIFINNYKEGIFTKSSFEKFCKNIDESLEYSTVNLQRIGCLVQSFKQISFSQNQYSKLLFDLQEHTEHICNVARKEKNFKGNSLLIEGQKDISMTSCPEALTFILNQFIDNSLLHGFTGEEPGTMTISLEQDGDKVIIKYKDDGNGMTSENVEKVFDPFFTTNKGTGSGLGSHIVYNIVTHTLLGRIKCESSVGKGVIFTMTLPCNIKGHLE